MAGIQDLGPRSALMERDHMPAAQSIETRGGVAYATHDGVSLLGDLYLPAGAGPFPALVAAHGGGWQAGARSAFQFLPLGEEGTENVSAGGQRCARGRAIRARQRRWARPPARTSRRWRRLGEKAPRSRAPIPT